MKYLLFFVLCLPFAASAQDSLLHVMPLKDGAVCYSGVAPVDSASATELYDRARRWIVEAYKSANAVVQLDDKENGELIAKGYFKAYWTTSVMGSQDVSIDHTIRISVKNGRYRYEISNLRVRGYTTGTRYSSGPWEHAIEEMAADRPRNVQRNLSYSVVPEIRRIIASLQKAMNTPIAAKQEW